MDVEGEMENLTDPLLTQLSTEAHTQTLKNQTDKCAGADTGRLRHKPHTRPGTSISIDGGLPQQVSLIVPQEREFTKETKTLKQGRGEGRVLARRRNQPTKSQDLPLRIVTQSTTFIKDSGSSYSRKEL